MPAESVEPEVPVPPVVPEVPPVDPDMPVVEPPLPPVEPEVPGEVEPLLVPALVPVVDCVEPGDWSPPPRLQATSAKGASRTRTPAIRRPDGKLEVVIMVCT